MKKKIFFTLLILSTFLIKAQNIKTDNFEIYLNDYEESEIAVSKGMYMTHKMQYFYEGVMEVADINTNKTKSYRFFFSKWDEVFKGFTVKDMNYNVLSPDYTFTDNNTISFTNTNGKVESKTLENVSNIEYASLSSMLVWLNSLTVAEKPTEKILNENATINNATSDKPVEGKSLDIKLVKTKKVPQESKPEKKESFESKLAAVKKKKLTNKPVVEKLVADRLIDKKPATDTLVVKKTITDKLTDKKPVTNTPVIEKLVTDKLTDKKPATDTPVVEKLVTDKLTDKKPATDTPVEKIVKDKLTDEKKRLKP